MAKQIAEQAPDRAFEDVRFEDWGNSPAEEEVLRVLWSNPGRYLVRSGVHHQIPRDDRPTLVRVGQILSKLFKEGFAERSMRRSQGARRAAHYRLSALGVELCRRQGFEREERTLFAVDDDMLREYLTPERLTKRPDVKPRIRGFYAFRGGVGCTTLVAHVARLLAEKSPNEPHLVLDLDLNAPGLDRFFATGGAKECRGLRGLVTEYRARHPRRRATWLREVLESGDYALYPFPGDLPNLAYIPSGLSGADGTTAERAEALHLLRQEAGQLRLDGFLETSEEEGFLHEFRAALHATWPRVIIDAQPGRSLGAWITTYLAEDLLLCVRTNDDSEATLDGLRAILTSYLAAHENVREKVSAGVIAVQDDGGVPTTGWVHRKLLRRDVDTCPVERYRAWKSVYTSRMARTDDPWKISEWFEDVATQLDAKEAVSQITRTPELEALLKIIDPEIGFHQRHVAAGFLGQADFEDLAICLKTYSENPGLHHQIDDEGRTILQSMSKTIAFKLYDKILRTP